MSEHTRAAALAAMTVPGINRAEFRDGPDGPVGTVRYSPARLFGEPGPEFEVRRDPDGLWNVNGDRDIRDPDLATAIRAAIAATCGETAAGPASRAQPCTRGHETRYRADDGDADTGCQRITAAAPGASAGGPAATRTPAKNQPGRRPRHADRNLRGGHRRGHPAGHDMTVSEADAMNDAEPVQVWQVWRTDHDGLYAVVAVQQDWVYCKRSRGYKPEHRYGESFQVHPAHFRSWDLVTPRRHTLGEAYQPGALPAGVVVERPARPYGTGALFTTDTPCCRRPARVDAVWVALFGGVRKDCPACGARWRVHLAAGDTRMTTVPVPARHPHIRADRAGWVRLGPPPARRPRRKRKGKTHAR